ncbi:hypothetical protein FGIG_02017 [Fasciola gigantica]|uniref:Uncharacterized protein n=1 Tax=Fasciola gigantica TaxID=46835 RepID=A0A504YZG6_FASGI|nr:hypothetical protein FGIG_02017 [Fasciola gigantica]
MRIAILNKETFFTSNYIFTANTTEYDPRANPLTSFKVDQLETLNPRKLHEIKQLNTISLCDHYNAHLPSTDEMETCVACIDAGE